MKAWFKYGLSVLAGLTFSVAALAAEPTPIEDRDAFEKQYIFCVETGLKNKCFVSIFSGHLVPNIKNADEGLSNLNESYLNGVMSGSYGYKVHILDKTMRAGIFDSRTYLIERSDGTLIGSYIIFRKIQGKWYVYEFSIQGSDVFIRELLKFPTMSLDAE
jgi:hypothetical protein